MQQSLISIIVPVYKAEDYLQRCVESIRKQTYTCLEIILVNDGSPDGSGAICDALAESDSRIKVIHKPNGGASSARNAGLDAARGEFVAFVDSDDKLVDMDMYEKLHKRIIEADADICVCGYLEFYNGYSRTVRVPFEKKLMPTQLWEVFLENFRQCSHVFFHVVNKLFRKYMIDEDGIGTGLPIRYNVNLSSSNDSWFTINCGAVASKGIVFVDFIPYAYMRGNNPTSITKTASVENAEKVLNHMGEIMLKALPQRADDIVKTIKCQICVSVTMQYHRAVINKQKPRYKVTWRTVRTILQTSNNPLDRYSALLMFILPNPLYRTVFKMYCKYM